MKELQEFTKQHLIEELCLSNDIASKAAAKRIIDVTLDTIIRHLAAGHTVSIAGLGKLRTAVREGVKPQSTERYRSIVVRFKAAKALKVAVSVLGK